MYILHRLCVSRNVVDLFPKYRKDFYNTFNLIYTKNKQMSLKIENGIYSYQCNVNLILYFMKTEIIFSSLGA